jgi:very-short-patch-repair endonuclease
MYGRWMAAVLTCGTEAVLSYESAAELFEIVPQRRREISVSVPANARIERPGIVTRRRKLAPEDVTRHHGIPLTSPVCTLIDLGAFLDRDQLEAAINEGRQARPDRPGDPPPGARRGHASAWYEGPPRDARRTFTCTDSTLERLFLPIVRRVGLSRPETGCRLNGFKVDFYWPDLGLVVETDGLRYHRTPAQQASDRIRDQAHSAAGLTPLRFTRAQVRFEPAHVEATLLAVARRLGATRDR